MVDSLRYSTRYKHYMYCSTRYKHTTAAIRYDTLTTRGGGGVGGVLDLARRIGGLLEAGPGAADAHRAPALVVVHVEYDRERRGVGRPFQGQYCLHVVHHHL